MEGRVRKNRERRKRWLKAITGTQNEAMSPSEREREK